MFHGVRCVLFDLDGTLIDSAPDLGLAADEMRLSRGLPSLPLEAYRSMAGSGARGMLSVAFGLTPEDERYATLREEFLNNYERRMMHCTGVFSGVEELLDALRSRGLTWGIVTNKAQRFTQPLMAAMPLFADAAAIISGDTTPHAKPHPAPLWEAMRRANVQPEHCVYVGDDERDVRAGKAAGISTIAASYGYLGLGDVASWQADAVISQPGELLSLLGP
ncbi:phosphoglycolate phosphatase [Ottowia caeni]|uniref:phosphoglycolate phosphatase n=1 Tax=Ottowia caeni TaxID=2870339 RepID=UPI001E65A6D4|nr:phosphoglycolate phosphatase [Ottowia caeni]